MAGMVKCTLYSGDNVVKEVDVLLHPDQAGVRRGSFNLGIPGVTTATVASQAFGLKKGDGPIVPIDIDPKSIVGENVRFSSVAEKWSD